MIDETGMEKYCIDPEMQMCQWCEFGCNVYSPDEVECAADLEGCCFETICTLDEKRYNKWCREKQMPIKPKIKSVFEGEYEYQCAKCGTEYIQVKPCNNYCAHCGQRLDWSVEDESL